MTWDTSTKLRGVSTHGSRIREQSAGYLARAESIVFDRDDLAEPRRGVPFESLATFVGTPGDAFKRMIAYGGALIMHVATTLRRRVSASSYSSYTGTFAVPEAGYQIRDAQQNGSLFLTSSTGIRKLDSLTGTFANAGVPAPLDSTYSLTGGSGFLGDDFVCGYRFTLYTFDASDVEIESAPSGILTVTNEAGGSRNVAHTVYIPSGLSTSYYWRAYRSAQVALGGVPSDELQLAAEGQLSSTNITNGNFTFTDATTDDLRQATLYTSPSIEGIAQANEQPPLARDLCVYEGCMFYFNVTGKQRHFFKLLGVGTTALRYVADNVDTTNGSPIVTSIADTSVLRVGMRVKAAAGLPGPPRILTIDSATQVTLTLNANATGSRDVEFQDVLRLGDTEYFGASAVTLGREFVIVTSGTASQNLEATARNIVRAVNADANTAFYARYESAFDAVPGEIQLYERAIGGAQGFMSTTATEAISPTWPTTSSTLRTKPTRRANGCIFSKPDQPGAAPLANALRLGNTTVKRALPIRGAIVVLSDAVGLITGESRGNFAYEEIDPSAKLLAPESAVVVSDAVYAMTTQGVVRITPAGVQVASREVERDLLKHSKLASFAGTAHAVAYETDRAYLLWVPTAGADTYAKYVWRLNLFNNNWSNAIADASCAIVDPADDKLVIADQAVSLVRRENKALDSTDYFDGTLAVTVTSASGLVLNLSSTANLLAGDLIVQSSLSARITSVDSGTALTMRRAQAWSAGAATAYRPVDCGIETLPYTAGDPAVLKHFTKVKLLFRSAEFGRFTVAFATNVVPNFEAANTATIEPEDHASNWGTTLPVGSNPDDEGYVEIDVPFACQYALWLRMRITWSIALETMAFAGVSYEVTALSGGYQGSAQS